MKLKKFSGKLSLKKVTITNLSGSQLNGINGGIIVSDSPKVCTDVSIPLTYCCTQGCDTQDITAWACSCDTLCGTPSDPHCPC